MRRRGIYLIIGLIILAVIATAIYYEVTTVKRTQQANVTVGTRGKVLVVLYPYFRWEEYSAVSNTLMNNGFRIDVLCMTSRDTIPGLDLEGKVHIVKCTLHLPLRTIDYSKYLAVVFIGGPGLYCVLEYHAHELGLHGIDQWCVKMLGDYLKESDKVLDEGVKIARIMYKNGRIVAAICVAPVILCMAHLLQNRPFTMFTCDVTIRLVRYYGCTELSRSPVVRSGEIVTACGPQAAQSFARTVLELIEHAK
ncbi:MAG: hypothetical protein GXO10_06785 [Crenarchaeota archaeon]|nr:hypothetical protein [Thermoproteota archaeon]